MEPRLPDIFLLYWFRTECLDLHQNGIAVQLIKWEWNWKWCFLLSVWTLTNSILPCNAIVWIKGLMGNDLVESKRRHLLSIRDYQMHTKPDSCSIIQTKNQKREEISWELARLILEDHNRTSSMDTKIPFPCSPNYKTWARQSILQRTYDARNETGANSPTNNLVEMSDHHPCCFSNQFTHLMRNCSLSPIAAECIMA